MKCDHCQTFFTSEEGLTRTKAETYTCEECYDPNDSEQQEKGRLNYKELKNSASIVGNTQKTTTKTFTNTFTKEEEKDQEKAKEINSEELNAQVEIPKELNIIDCPPDINPNPEWFRIQFRNFWRLFHNDSEWVFVIHDRGTCKSKNDAINVLYDIVMNDDTENSFIMRNWEEPTRQTKEYFKKIIREFDEVIYVGEKKIRDKSKWGLLWLSTYKGVSYKKNILDKTGELRCHFLDLFNPEQARTLINKPIRTVIFDECIPTRNQIKDGKGWKLDESAKYMEAMKSLGRNTKPKKVFTGNPNDSFYECWFLVKHFKEELKQISKWYWKNRPNSLDRWLNWTWTKELKKGNKTLQLQKIATKQEDFDNYEEGNWDNFFEKMEDLKIVDHKNGSLPQYVFNSCFAYVSKDNYYYFVDQRSREISGRDRKEFKNLPEMCYNDEQRRRSRQAVKWDRQGEAGVKFQKNLLRLYETNLLFFADTYAKKIMETFIGKRKIIDTVD